MNILVFGTYDKHRIRLRVILEGLRRLGWRIEECHLPVWGSITDRTELRPGRWPLIALRFLVAYSRLPLRFLFKRHIPPVVLVSYLGHLDVLLARFLSLFRPRLIVFDVFISLYDTVVRDRKLVSPHSLTAKLLFLLDKYACKCADVILFDTDAHARFFKDTFDLHEIRWARVFVSADPKGSEDAEPALRSATDVCRVFYYGHYTPLHGIETIIRAASLLRSRANIEFVLAGRGQTYGLARELARELGANNIRWLGWMPFEEILEIAENSDITLGIFGTSEKALNVIPLKVYGMMAAGKAIVTADTPAARELLEDGIHCLLVPPGDAERLASAIERLASSPELRLHLMRNARQLFLDRLAPEQVVRPMVEGIDDELYIRRNWIAAPRYRLRVHCVKELLAKKRPGYFLEVGCGAGAFLRWLASRGFEGIGTDLSGEALALSGRMLGSYGKQIKLIPVDKLSVSPGELDYLFSFEVLEHIADDKATLAAWHSWLKPGGTLLLSVPSHQSKWGASDIRVGHYRRYERADVRNLLETLNFEIVTIRSYGFPMANVADWIRNLVDRRTHSEWEKRSKELLSQKSGVDRQLERKWRFLISDLFLLPFYYLQKCFYNSDLGTGYVVEARRCRTEVETSGASDFGIAVETERTAR